MKKEMESSPTLFFFFGTLFQALDITDPPKDKWISSPSRFSSFFTIVVLQLDKGDYLKIGMLYFVLTNSTVLKLLIVWILF